MFNSSRFTTFASTARSTILCTLIVGCTSNSHGVTPETKEGSPQMNHSDWCQPLPTYFFSSFYILLNIVGWARSGDKEWVCWVVTRHYDVPDYILFIIKLHRTREMNTHTQKNTPVFICLALSQSFWDFTSA